VLPVVANKKLTEHHTTIKETPSTPVIEANRAKGVISICELANKFQGKPVSIQLRKHSKATHTNEHCSGQSMRCFKAIARNCSHASGNPEASFAGKISQQKHAQTAGYNAQ